MRTRLPSEDRDWPTVFTGDVVGQGVDGPRVVGSSKDLKTEKERRKDLTNLHSTTSCSRRDRYLCLGSRDTCVPDYSERPDKCTFQVSQTGSKTLRTTARYPVFYDGPYPNLDMVGVGSGPVFHEPFSERLFTVTEVS